MTYSKGIKPANDIEGLRRSALWHLSRRDHSEQELRDKMARKTANQHWIDAVISECYDYGYLNDPRFAENLIRSLQNKGFGIKRIKRELYNKGLEPHLSSQLLASTDCDYIASACKLLSKKYNQSLAKQYDKQKAMAFLQAKGHVFDDIFIAIDQHNEAYPEEDDEHLSTALALLAKKFYSPIIEKKQRDKALRLLQSRAYNFSECNDAITAFNDKLAQDEE